MLCPLPAVVLLFVLAVSARADDTLVAYRNEYDPYLRYVSAISTFPHGVATFTYGDFRLVDGVTTQFLRLDSLPPDGHAVEHRGAKSVQTMLLPFLRTQPFVLGTRTASFAFTRDLDVSNDVDDGDVERWRFDDRTVCTIEIRDARTDAIVAVIDSVGVDSSTVFADRVPFLGQAHEHCRHRVPTATWPRGVPLYAQVVPRREGPTPFGMTLTGTQAPYAQGPRCEGSAKADDTGNERLRSMLFARAKDYVTAMRATFCESPLPVQAMGVVTPEQYDVLHNLILKADTTWYGGTPAIVGRPHPCDTVAAERRRTASDRMVGSIAVVDGALRIPLTMAAGPVDIVVVRASDNATVAAATSHVPSKRYDVTLPVLLEKGSYSVDIFQAGTGSIMTRSFDVDVRAATAP